MPTVDVDGNTYDVYADVAAADVYLAASTHADAWRAADDDAKARGLVTATRTIDRQQWKGEEYYGAQPLAWPRVNTGVEGVEDTVVPPDIVTASIEMASALVDGTDLQNEQNTSQKLQSIKAGSVSLTYFRGAEGVARRFPQIIWELLSPYLAGGGDLAGYGAKAFGVDGRSSTSEDFGHTEGI